MKGRLISGDCSVCIICMDSFEIQDNKTDLVAFYFLCLVTIPVSDVPFIPLRTTLSISDKKKNRRQYCSRQNAKIG